MKDENKISTEFISGLGFGGISWFIFEALVAIGLRENAAGVVTICFFLGAIITSLEKHITRMCSNRMDEK